MPLSIGGQSSATLPDQNQLALPSTSTPSTHSWIGANESGSRSDSLSTPSDWQYLDNITNSSRDRQRSMPYLSDSSWMMPSGDSDSTGFELVTNSHTPPTNLITQLINGGREAQAIPDSAGVSRAGLAEITDTSQSDAVEIDHARASSATGPSPTAKGLPSHARSDENKSRRYLEIVQYGQEEPARKQRK